MKKFIFMLIAMFTMTIATVSAQSARFSGTLGVTATVEPHNSNLISFPETFNVSIGCRWDNGLFLGGGIAPGFDVEHAHWKGGSNDETSFIMPFYAQLSYVQPHGYFADVKIGGEDVIVDGHSGTFFFLNITPIGYSFDEHNSIGLGWRYHHKNQFNGHGISLTYQYMF